MAIAMRCASARGRPFVRSLSADARRLLQLSALDDCELSLMIVDDRAIRRLNRRFRGKDQPTDVLSFPQHDAVALRRATIVRRDRGALLGDVVISIDTAVRQSRALEVTPRMRVRTLLVHGFLHLLGFDHERSAADARRMFAREANLLTALRAARSRS